MAKRKDGAKTRERIMEAACVVFAEKGYRNARVADICRRAGANVAAVNYYFGDKERLYTGAWQYAFEQFAPKSLRPSQDGSNEDRLGIFIHTLMQHFMDQGALGQFTRLYMMELANPTGLIQDTWHDLIKPRRRELLEIIRDLMGAAAIDERVLFCEMSIINQCRAVLTVSRSDLEYLLEQPLSPDLIRRLADHITRFSIAGIQKERNG